MTMVRSRLFTILILTAVAVSVVGVNGASAKARTRSSTHATSHATTATADLRPPVGPYSGEPDAGSGGVPKQSQPTTLGPTGVVVVGSDVWLLLWALWVARP